MRILVTGGCGYVGSVLVPKLLSLGHSVDVVDIMWFGNFLKPHRNLGVAIGDIRDAIHVDGVDAIIHLAGVANDPCGELDPKLSWEINTLATMRLADNAYRNGVRFIYASSGSVYGVKEEEQVTEDLTCEPLSEYNKTKMVSERVVLSYGGQIVRPATVCGYSPRMRLDVVVNMLTMQALTKGEITVLGGSQMRPHIHIEDMTDLYVFLLDHPEIQGVYNAGFENYTVMELAQSIAKKTGVKINVLESNDARSYRMNSDKIANRGFVRKHSVMDAIEDLSNAWHEGRLKDEDRWYNLRMMK